MAGEPRAVPPLRQPHDKISLAMPGFGFSEPIIELGTTLLHHVTRDAPTQGGVIAGDNPTEPNSNDPLRLWAIQVIIIILTTQLLSLVLRTIRQPRVISEVLSGIILGPSIFGRIPNFSKTIFPPESLPYLTLTANIGLVLFLFLVGLETDTRVISRNAKYSVFVAAGGMLLPFGLGTGVASLVYEKFVDHETVSFGQFLLFVGVAFAITAFPVLCRILTELNLLETTVGIVVLSAGVGNDIVAWVLLALAVSLVNASTGLTALWVLLATAGFAIFILFPVKWAFIYMAKSTGTLEVGAPSAFMMTVTILLVFASAFMTDILGVHPIFGGFLAGLVIPHESGFAIALTEKLEDLVSLLFLPVYFTLSGLKTDLGLLNNGITWGYTFLIMTVAFIGKFVGAFSTSKFLGFNLREAGAIGVLMSCKGLVELIVLNIGLQAKILDPRVFAMFVIEALVLTFITTPLTLLIYPASVRTQHSAAKRKKDDEATDKKGQGGETGQVTLDRKLKIAVMLHKLEHISPLMTMTQLLGPLPRFPPSTSSITVVDSASDSQAVTETPAGGSNTPPAFQEAGPTIDALRLMELSDRTSAVMYGSVTAELLDRDPLVSALRTFARIHRIPVSTASLSVTPYEEFPAKISERAIDVNADLVLVPWNTTLHPVVGPRVSKTDEGTSHNPFESLFGRTSSVNNMHIDRSASVAYAQFVRKVFATSAIDVALFIEHDNTGSGALHEYDEKPKPIIEGHHIFFAYFGGPDDRLALSFIVQLCGNGGGLVQATVIRMTKTEADTSADASKVASAEHNEAVNMLTTQSAAAFPDTVYGPETTQNRLASETADTLAWGRFAHREPGAFSAEIEKALSLIVFVEASSSTPVAECIDRATKLSQGEEEEGAKKGFKKNILIVVGRGRRMAAENHHDELKTIMTRAHPSRTHVGSDARKTLGDVGAAFVVAGPEDASILVMQSAHRSTDV